MTQLTFNGGPRGDACKHVKKHTVFTLPRTLDWHVTKRIPAAIKDALAEKITTVIAAFQYAGIDFDDTVTLSFQTDTGAPNVAVDFEQVDMERIRTVCPALHKHCDEMYRIEQLCPPAMSRGVGEKAIKVMLQDYLRLSRQAFNELQDRLSEQIKAELSSHAVGFKAHRRPNDWDELLEYGEGPLDLAGPSDVDGIDTLIALVYAKAPWMDAPLSRIWYLMKAHAGAGLRMPPILLHGPGGTGKSMLAELISEEASPPSLEMDGSAGGAAFRIAGVESGWSSARIGEPLRFIAEQRCPNPIIVINEVDKALGGMKVTSGTPTSLVNALLPMLDANSAKSFRCPASGLVCDLSRINWILTANDIGGFSQPFLSRLELLHVPALSMEQYFAALEILCPDNAKLKKQLRHLVSKEWRRPNFSLRMLSRLIWRLKTEAKRPQMH